MPASRSATAPIIATGVAAVLFAAALLSFLFLRTDDASAAGGNTYTSSEAAAVSAASTETANLLTFRRAQFDADFNRALAGSTGAIRSDIQAKKSDTLQAMNAGKFDLSADVTHSALIGPVDDPKVDGYEVLVSLNGYRSTQKTLPTQQNLQVTVVRKDGKWLVNDVRNIGVS